MVNLSATERPNPLAKVASSVGTAWSSAGAVLGGATAFGLLTAAQAQAIDATGQALPGAIMALGTIAGTLIPLVAGIVASFRTVAAGKSKVTPLEDPMNNLGERLTPEGR